MHCLDKKFEEKKLENKEINKKFYAEMQENHKVEYTEHEIDMDPAKLDEFQQGHKKFSRMRE